MNIIIFTKYKNNSIFYKNNNTFLYFIFQEYKKHDYNQTIEN